MLFPSASTSATRDDGISITPTDSPTLLPLDLAEQEMTIYALLIALMACFALACSAGISAIAESSLRRRQGAASRIRSNLDSTLPNSGSLHRSDLHYEAHSQFITRVKKVSVIIHIYRSSTEAELDPIMETAIRLSLSSTRHLARLMTSLMIWQSVSQV